MDGRSFDAFARSLAAGVQRRRVLISIAAGLTGTPLDQCPGDAAAACAGVGDQYDLDQDCCNGARCKNATCTCKGAYEECHGKCYRPGELRCPEATPAPQASSAREAPALRSATTTPPSGARAAAATAVPKRSRGRY